MINGINKLTNEQRQQFRDEGYLIVRNALNEDRISRLIEAGDRLIATDERFNRFVQGGGIYDGFRNCITMDDAYIPLLTNDITLPLVIQLLGSNLQLSTSHLIHRHPDPPGTSNTVRRPGWHRDGGGISRDLGEANFPRMGLKCAFYLTDLSEPNSGVTMLAPGSNQLTERIEIPEGEVDPANALEPLLNPGDCVIFEYRTWHAGAPNFTDRTRKAVMIGYCYRWLKPMDYVKQDSSFVDKLSDIEKYLAGEEVDDTPEFQPSGGFNPLNEWCEKHGVEQDHLGL
ncbi:MAG: phytanoyl-CoA dioxygenase family protein [Chloroflexota bacterium]|nr:phytanoyl-CoA dioxygenase family protein [Chloroflexota bacterium]MDE2946868.1 phytanoyl-CoA dioxygenase family protein [Chloroflexota bacterium]